MEQIEKCGWFSANELENFIKCAQEKSKAAFSGMAASSER